MTKTNVKILFLVLFMFAASVYVYQMLPDSLASHWDFNGKVNGYMSKIWGAFLLPLVSVGMALLFIVIPKIDPLKKNIEYFRKYFESFIILLFLFFLYLHILMLAWNLDYRFDITKMLVPALAILIYYIGALMAHSKRNWFIGIRTPWTLSSDKVWDRTHKVASRFMKLTALLTLFGLGWPNLLVYFFFIPLIITMLYSIIYSYLEFKK